MARIIFTARTWQLGGDIVTAKPGGNYVDAVDRMMERSARLHGGFLTHTLELPFRTRSTGPGSSSNHLHGHLSQLAVHFGYTMGEMKEIMKDDVPEWPVEPRKIGRRVKMRPVSESVVSMEVESKGIDWCHMIAGEEGIILIEGEGNK